MKPQNKIFLGIIFGILLISLSVNYFNKNKHEKNNIAIFENSASLEAIRNSTNTVSVQIPENWNYTKDQQSIGSLELFPSHKMPDISQGYIGDILITVLKNPKELSLNDFYENTAIVNLFAVAESWKKLSLVEKEAIRFSHVTGFLESEIVSIRSQNNIVEISDFGLQHQEDGIFDAVVDSIDIKKQ